MTNGLTLAFVTVAHVCSVTNPHDCKNYMGFADYSQNYTLPMCTSAVKQVTQEYLNSNHLNEEYTIKSVLCKIQWQQGL